MSQLLLACVFVRRLAAMLRFQRQVTWLANFSVIILSVLVRDVLDGCTGATDGDRYILAALALNVRLRWVVVLVRRRDRLVIKI